MIAYLSTPPREPGSRRGSANLGDTEDVTLPALERAFETAAGNGPLTRPCRGLKRKFGLFGNWTVATVKFAMQSSNSDRFRPTRQFMVPQVRLHMFPGFSM